MTGFPFNELEQRVGFSPDGAYWPHQSQLAHRVKRNYHRMQLAYSEHVHQFQEFAWRFELPGDIRNVWSHTSLCLKRRTLCKSGVWHRDCHGKLL